MNLQLVVISAACLSIFAVPASSTSLLAAAAAVKGAIFGAGLTALKTSGGSQTVVVQAEPGTVAEVVPIDEIVVRDPVYTPTKPIYAVPQMVSYSYSSNPISRLWSAFANVISAKTRAIGQLFNSGSNQVIIVKVPTTTTEKSTTEKTTTTEKSTTSSTTTTTTKKPHHHEPIVIEFEASLNKPAYGRAHPMPIVQYLKK